MMNEHLTEEEIQRYALRADECPQTITEHVAVCEACMLRIKEYQVIFQAISEHPEPVFDFDLVAAVLERAEPVKKSAKHNWLFWVLVLLCALLTGAGTFIFRNYLLALYAGVTSFTLYLIITGAATLFVILCVDMYKSFQKKMRALELY